MDLNPPDGSHPEDARVDESYALHKTLTEDLTLFMGPANAGDQAARRAYVRAAFALMDGMSYRMKETALKVGGAVLSDGERALLQEAEYRLDDKGHVKTRKARLKTLENYRFTFGMLVKAGNSEWAPAYNGDGWRTVRAAIAVRHQLTHPKSLADLHVSDEQLGGATRAVTWFTSSMLKIMFGIAEAQGKRLGRAVELPAAFDEHIAHIERSVK